MRSNPHLHWRGSRRFQFLLKWLSRVIQWLVVVHRNFTVFAAIMKVSSPKLKKYFPYFLHVKLWSVIHTPAVPSLDLCSFRTGWFELFLPCFTSRIPHVCFVLPSNYGVPHSCHPLHLHPNPLALHTNKCSYLNKWTNALTDSLFRQNTMKKLYPKHSNQNAGK